MKKRLLAVFMALCLIVGLLPVSVLAVETKDITMKVGDTSTIACGKWAKWDSLDKDKYWSNDDYRVVQLTAYRPIIGNVVFNAISPGTTTITLYEDKDHTRPRKTWVVTVKEDNNKSDSRDRDSFTFSNSSSNIEVAYSYVVDKENNTCSDLISMERGETIRLPGTADKYRIAFYVKAKEGYIENSTFECPGSDGYYDPIGHDSKLPQAAAAKAQGYTKEFAFSDSESGYPDREFKITAVPVKVSVQYENGVSNNSVSGMPQADKNVYVHKNVTDVTGKNTITVSDAELTRPGYVFMGWKISTDGVELDTKETYQGGESITLNDETWESANEENATITFTAQWEEDENGDDVPDIYQATVTYQVENGTWDGTNSAPKKKVFSLWKKNTDGTWSEKATAPTLDNTIPTGMQPNPGYEGGSWNDEINKNTSVTNDAIYTYRFTEKQTYNLTYNANGGTFGTSEKYNVTGISATDEYTLGKEEGYQNPTHLEKNGVKVAFAGWTTTNTNKAIYDVNDTVPSSVPSIKIPSTDTVFALWGYDRDRDGKPDFQEDKITVTYKIIHGTWENGSNSIVYHIPEGGKLGASIPDRTKVTPDDKYTKEGTWLDGKAPALDTEVTTDGDYTYTYVLNRVAVETIQKVVVTVGENLKKERPELDSLLGLHAEYGSERGFITLSPTFTSNSYATNVISSIPNDLTTDIDTVDEAKAFFSGFTFMKVWDNPWVSSSYIASVSVDREANDGPVLYITLDAQPKYTLVYDAVSGTFASGSNLYIVMNQPANDHYQLGSEEDYANPIHANVNNKAVAFAGWSTTRSEIIYDKNATNVPTLVTEINFPAQDNPAQGTSVYAVWGYDENNNGVANAYTITASAGNGGSISPTSATVSHGGSQTFTISAYSGNHIVDVKVDGVSMGAVGTYTFSNVTAAHSISATFAKDDSGTVDPTPSEYILRYETNGGKKIDSETYKKAWTKDYDELPVPVRAGYVFEGWYRNSTLTMPVTGDVYVNSGVVTLFAKWSEDDGLTPDDTGVSRWLNTEDHFSYLQGMPNNSFGPGQNITRAEVAQMFYNLLLNKNVPTTVSFTDVAADAWYADAVNALASMGILNGVGGGKFEPTRNITRAEFTAIAMRFGDLDTTGFNPFSDVNANDWFYAEVVGSVQYGWIKGFTDGTFRPYLSITRAEVTVIVNRMLGRSADQAYVDKHSDELRQFADVGTDNWAYYDIAEATNSHDYAKSGSGERWTDLW